MVITLLTDFGDVYPASMKGVILSIDPDACIVDISHSVKPQDVRCGAFMLMTCARYFPGETVHVAVVDPGVGTQRRALAIKAESNTYGVHYFAGPDNGLLIPAAKSIGHPAVYEITNSSLFRKDISGTFHGRDIFAPVGAHISRGLDICDVGRHISDFVTLDFGEGKKKDDSIEGSIIFIDSFGNIVTNISKETVNSLPGNILEIQGRRIPFHSSYGSCKDGEPLALIGSHGYLEIAVNRGNAADFFNKNVGEDIIMKFSPNN